jgi:ATP-dependent Lon protease
MSLNYKDSDRKRKSFSKSLRDFIVDDRESDSDYIPTKRKNTDRFESDSDSDSILTKRKNTDKFYREKERHTRKLSEEKEITMDDVFDLNLSDNENVWFYDYISIRDNADDAELMITYKNKVFDRYNMLKKLKMDGIDNIYCAPEDDIMNKILESSHSIEYKSKLVNIIKDKLKNAGSEEYHKAIELVNTVLDIPTKIQNTDPDITTITNKLACCLDESMYGMENVKLKILESVCSILCSKNGDGKILTLVGPPGVGKTAICSVISKAMNMPFSTISLGSVNDPSDLCGHASTYIGARPGRFLNILRQAKQLDNLILLDEVDKLNSKGTHESSISSILIHVLDPSQNDKIRDAYCQDFPFDMSKTFFILSCNDITKIDKILLDRLEIIDVNGYTINEKAEIACRHLIPKLIEKYRMAKKDCVIVKSNVMELIKLYEGKKGVVGDTGVRLISRFFETIFCKLMLSKNIDKNSKYHNMLKSHNLKIPLVINKSLLSIV